MKKNNEEVVASIHRVAGELILLHGPKGWNMDMICKRCAIAKDTLYRIIGSKEDLIRDALLGALREHNEKMESLLNEDKDFSSILKGGVNQLGLFLGKFSPEIVHQVFLEYPAIEKSVDGEMKKTLKAFESFFEGAKSSGKLKRGTDSKFLARIIHNAVMDFIKAPEAGDPARETELFLDYLIGGVGEDGKLQ